MNELYQPTLETVQNAQRAAHDLTGRRYGRLTALEQAAPAQDGRSQWLCQCDCGRLRNVRTKNLIRGNTQSCGCLPNIGNTRHGMCRSPEYRAWEAMLTRCTNPNAINYARYGGRGIKVCNRWRKFENFYADMGSKPSLAHSIDRVNNDGNYTPSNCRWATRTEQNINRSLPNNRFLTANGKTQTLAAWARETGIRTDTLHARLKRGWDDERAINTPLPRIGAAAITTTGATLFDEVSRDA